MSHSATHAIRLHLIEAMRKRAAGHDGEARRVVDERVAILQAAYADDLVLTRNVAAAPSDESVQGALGRMVGEWTGEDTSARSAPPYPELAALDDFRKIWAKVRTEGQLRQSLKQVPENAGPLNSSALVHRSIALMRELSPGYLQQFLSYVDDLSLVDQLNLGGALANKEAPQAASIGKRARKPRARRD